MNCFCRKKKSLSNKPIIASPNLTELEIKKIQDNLAILIQFNKDIASDQNTGIMEVWQMLKGAEHKNDAPDATDGKKGWLTILVSAIEIIGIVTENPVIDIAGVVIGGVAEFCTNDPSSSAVSNVNLDLDFGLLSVRCDNTAKAITNTLAAFKADPNTYRDQPLTLPNQKTCTLRDLINNKIPNESSVDYNLAIQAQGRQFRNSITIPEMEKMQFWDIYFVLDYDNGLIPPPSYSFGTIWSPKSENQYRPEIRPPPKPLPEPTPAISYPDNFTYFLRTRDFNADNVGDGKRVFANDEIRQYHPDYWVAEGFGNSNDDLIGSYIHSINQFVKADKPAYVFPWLITTKKVYSKRWYIMEGYDKYLDGFPNYGFANSDFLNWLFIDDGAGNIVNENGIGYRYDIIFKTNIMSNAKYISSNIEYPSNEDVYVSSMDKIHPGQPTNKTHLKIYPGTKESLKLSST